MRKSNYSSLLLWLVILAIVVFLVYTYNKPSNSGQQNSISQRDVQPGGNTPTLETLSYKDVYEINNVPSLRTLTSTCFISNYLKYLPFVGDEPNVDNIDEYSSDTKCGYSWLGTEDNIYDDKIVYRVKTLTSINLGNNEITEAQGWKLQKWDPATNQFITKGDDNVQIRYGDKVRVQNVVNQNAPCNFAKGKVYLAHSDGCNDLILDSVNSNVTYFTIRSPIRRQNNTPVFRDDPIVLVVNDGNSSVFGGLPTTVNLRKSKGEDVFGVEGLFDVRTLPTSLYNQNSWWKLN